MTFEGWIKGRGSAGAAAGVMAILQSLGIEGLHGLVRKGDAPEFLVTSVEGLVRFSLSQGEGKPWSMEARLVPWAEVGEVAITARMSQQDVDYPETDMLWHVTCRTLEFDDEEVPEFRRSEALAFWMDCYRRSVVARAT